MPFANAAKRGGTFIFVPIIVQPRSLTQPSFFKYVRTICPDSAALPASARPRPSRIERLPKCITSRGMSRLFVRTMNSATSAVREEGEVMRGFRKEERLITHAHAPGQPVLLKLGSGS